MSLGDRRACRLLDGRLVQAAQPAQAPPRPASRHTCWRQHGAVERLAQRHPAGLVVGNDIGQLNVALRRVDKVALGVVDARLLRLGSVVGGMPERASLASRSFVIPSLVAIVPHLEFEAELHVRRLDGELRRARDVNLRLHRVAVLQEQRADAQVNV